MKPLVIWLAVIGLAFGVLALVTGLTPTDTSRVFVLVDSSFAMTEVWDEVVDELDAIDDRSDAEFALATEKDAVHTWRDGLRLGAVRPFAPCGFDEALGYAEIAEADDLILITTDGSCDTASFDDSWEIRILEP